MELLFWDQHGSSSWESQLGTQLLGHNDPVIWNDSFPESMKGQIEHFIGADEKVTQKYMNFVSLKGYVINDPSRLFFHQLIYWNTSLPALNEGHLWWLIWGDSPTKYLFHDRISLVDVFRTRNI